VAANVALEEPAGTKVVRVRSAEDLRLAVLEAARGADAVVMAAAVADFRPATYTPTKIKKDATGERPTIELERTADVLRELVDARAPGQVVVGFAAETGDDQGDVLTHGRAKLARKGCDLLVVNDVGAGRAFEVADNAAVILGADGSALEVPMGPKEALADAVWDAVLAAWP
jgi:phosphopantothenoylcysteine decarboxylase/phosphopantothenate--cysteine ligase